MFLGQPVEIIGGLLYNVEVIKWFYIREEHQCISTISLKMALNTPW
jgi:hypothetical protein